MEASPEPSVTGGELYERRVVEVRGPGERPAPPPIHLHTVHDGGFLPPDLEHLAGAEFDRSLAEERDWGANAVAERLARHLGLDAWFRVRLARNVLDFARFPGISIAPVEHLGRPSVNPPMSRLLLPRDTARLLRLQMGMDRRARDLLSRALPDRDVSHRPQLVLGIHTYDPVGARGRRRPVVSVIHRPDYSMYPEIPTWTGRRDSPRYLTEYTADRSLAYRVALNLERHFLPVAVDDPYLLPVGSFEVRSQLAFFVRFLRAAWRARPGAVRSVADDALWRALLEAIPRGDLPRVLAELVDEGPVTLESVSLVSLRRLPAPRPDDGELAGVLSELATFLRESYGELAASYRFAPCRPSSLAIEVRKDWLYPDAVDGRYDAANLSEERAEEFALHLADAVRMYLEHDLEAKRARHRQLLAAGRWPPES